MIIILILIGCNSAGILPVEGPVDGVVLCGEAITINWGDTDDMSDSFLEALGRSSECPK